MRVVYAPMKMEIPGDVDTRGCRSFSEVQERVSKAFANLQENDSNRQVTLKRGVLDVSDMETLQRCLAEDPNARFMVRFSDVKTDRIAQAIL